MSQSNDLESRYKAAKLALENHIADPLNLKETQPEEFHLALEKLRQEVADLEKQMKENSTGFFMFFD